MDCAAAWRYGRIYGQRRPGLCVALSITPEDIAQESVVAFLETGRVGHRQLVDRIRRVHGRRGMSHRAEVQYRTWAVLDEPTGNGATLGDLLADDDDPYGPVDDRVAAETELARIYRQEPRMAAMLLLRANGWTLAAIGRRFGITESRCSQILTQFAA